MSFKGIMHIRIKIISISKFIFTWPSPKTLACSAGLYAATELSEQVVTSSLWQEATGFMANVVLILRNISNVPHVRQRLVSSTLALLVYY